MTNTASPPPQPQPQPFTFSAATSTLTLHFTPHTFSTALLPHLSPTTKMLHLHLPHAPAAKLRHLTHGATSRTVPTVYTPDPANPARPAFGDSTAAVTKHWGTGANAALFRAATDTAAFAALLSALPRLDELRVSCPGRANSRSYRKTCVDLALASLRAALERSCAPTPTPTLTQVVLDVHLRGVDALRSGELLAGRNPRVRCCWRGVRRLRVRVHSWRSARLGRDVAGVKMLRDFMGQFGAGLEEVEFAWGGKRRGPWPFGDAVAYRGLRMCEVRNVEVEAWVVEAFLLRQVELGEVVLRECQLSGSTDGLEVQAEEREVVRIRLKGVKRAVDTKPRSS